MAWRWTARRRALSAFVIFHLSALIVWTMPQCALKAAVQGPYRYYVLPTGMWQWWAIFAPDPIRNTMVLNAEVVDARGMRHTYEFPRLADLPWWQKLLQYRQPKFTANMVIDEYKRQREFTARHAVRQLGLALRRSRSGSASSSMSRIARRPGPAIRTRWRRRASRWWSGIRSRR